MKMVDWALFWGVKQGIPVYPAHEVHNSVCTCVQGSKCRTPGKHPRYHKDDLLNGQDDASIDARQIETWWMRWPTANIGGVMGGVLLKHIPHRTQLLALDLDPRNGGNATLADFCELYGLEWLDRTLQHKTGGGGLHFFFVVPDGVQIKGKAQLGPGLDVKWKGAVILPPSLHSSGERYEINVANMARQAPDWLIETLSQEQPATVIDFQEHKDRRFCDSTKEKFTEGERNNGLFRVGIGRWRHGWAIDMTDLHTQLTEVNEIRCIPPLDGSEVAKMVTNIATNYAHLKGVDQEKSA